MRKLLFAALTLMLALALASGAFAVGEQMMLKQDAIRTSQAMDLNVMTPKGEKVGAIHDITLDPKTGRIAFAVIEGDAAFVGASDRLYAIPWNALTPSAAGDHFVLNVDKSKIARAPSFSKDSWPNIADRSWMTEVYRYYGQTPHWQEGGKAPMKKEMKKEKSGY